MNKIAIQAGLRLLLALKPAVSLNDATLDY